MAWFFHAVVDTKNTEKVVEKRTGEYGEDIEHVISKAFQHLHVSFKYISNFSIITFNALDSYKMSAMIRARGEFDNRRYW